MESCYIDAHCVGANRQKGDEVMAGSVGFGIAGQAGLFRGGRDGDAGKRGAGLIEDVAGEAAGGLGMEIWRKNNCEQAEDCEL